MGNGSVSNSELLETDRVDLQRPLPSLRVSLLLALIAAVLWLALRVIVTLHVPHHEPEIHDEFSYLLGADTFLHGRLANPPHPMGRFFESPHVLIQPTYASKYPPGEAAWLALGTLLFGSPYAALILQGACLVFVLALMFCAWTRLRVAALMTFVAGFSLLPPTLHWTNSYWGPGSAAAMGAALVFLGLGWFLRSGKVAVPGFLVGLGAMELFFTRPYEGGVLCIAVLACTPSLARRWNPPRFQSLTRLALFAAPVLAIGFAWNLYYDKAVTGHALELPYLLHDKTYNTVPVFCFVPLRPEPRYGNRRLAAQHGLHGWEADKYEGSCSHRVWLAYTFVDTAGVIVEMLFPLLPLVLLFPLSWGDVRCRALLLISAAGVFATVVEVWHFSHYLAPAFVALLLFSACQIEYLAGSFLSQARLRRTLAVELILITLAYFGYQVRTTPLAADPKSFRVRRAQLIHKLSNLNGQQLVLVHYPDPDTCVIREWVYNGADPDSEKVVFAHDLGQIENEKLLSYYKTRTKWLLVAACNDYTLEPMPATGSLQSGQ